MTGTPTPALIGIAVAFAIAGAALEGTKGAMDQPQQLPLDLFLDGQGSVVGTWTYLDLAPGDVRTDALQIHRDGWFEPQPGDHIDLDLCIGVQDTDDAGDGHHGGPSPVPLSQLIVLDEFHYAGVDVAALVGDADGDGRSTTLHDLGATRVVHDLPDPGRSPGSTMTLTARLAPETTNVHQGDLVRLDIVFHLAQATSADRPAAQCDLFPEAP